MIEKSISFHLLRDGGCTIAVAAEFRNDVLAVLARADAPGSVPAMKAGRGEYPLVELPGGRGRVLVRSFRRGGMGRLWSRNWFLGFSRPMREFIVTLRAAARGVPVPRAVAARTRRRAGLAYRGELLTLELPGARDLAEVLREEWPRWGRADRTRALALAAGAARALHGARLWHADLNLRNLLWTDEAGAGGVYVIDLDRSRFYKKLPMRKRTGNLWRLARSLAKWEIPASRISRADRWRFLLAYAGENAPLREALADAFRRRPAVSAWRRLWWRLADVRTGERLETPR